MTVCLSIKYAIKSNKNSNHYIFINEFTVPYLILGLWTRLLVLPYEAYLLRLFFFYKVAVMSLYSPAPQENKRNNEGKVVT